MDDIAKPSLDRIDRAIERIERATSRMRDQRDRLTNRHEQLRARIGEAIGSIDALIATTEQPAEVD